MRGTGAVRVIYMTYIPLPEIAAIEGFARSDSDECPSRIGHTCMSGNSSCHPKGGPLFISGVCSLRRFR